MIYAFNKPYGIVSQFTKESEEFGTLAEFGFPKGVYPIGRLDATSEGLLLLGDERKIVNTLLDPKKGHQRTYLVQVEGEVGEAEIEQLESGVIIQGHKTAPASCMIALDITLPERSVPIRKRLSIPTTMLILQLTEGKNRQVRKMTASVGKPTLRLIRIAIGSLTLPSLPIGTFRPISPTEQQSLFVPISLADANNIAKQMSITLDSQR
jgi:23S rRNA pseudouridine2457 synthase